MCLFNNQVNCCQIRYLRGPMGPTGATGARGPIGPQGATGPVGPQGAPGVSGTSDIIYATNGGGTIATNTIIPVVLDTATPTSTMTVSGGAVNLPTGGTYLVNYSVSSALADGDNATTGLYYNGTLIPGETLISNGTTASRTALITVPNAGTLSLYNTSAESATVTDATLNVVKTA